MEKDDVEEEENEVEVENENAEDQEAEGENSSESSDWQIIDQKQGDEKQNECPVSREQLEEDEEALGRDRDDAMAEEFDDPRR